MKAKLFYPYLSLQPSDQFEAQKLALLPWCLSNPSGPYVYWTRLMDLAALFKIELDPNDVSLLHGAASVRPDLSHVAEPTDLGEFFTEKYRPRPYQLKAIAYLMEKGHAILGDDTGLGKSLMAMGAVIVREFRDPTDGSIVILCPSGIRWQWRTEIMRMFRNPYTAKECALDEDMIQILDGEPKLRKAILKMPARKVFIVSYDLLIRDEKEIMAHLKRKGVSAVIADESSRFKGSGTKTFAAVSNLTRTFQPRQVICLNATPIENNLEELWSQMFVVQPTIFPSFSDYDSTYIRRIKLRLQTGMTVTKIVGHQNIPHLRALIKDRYIRRRYQDVETDLPEVVVSNRFLDLGEAQRKAYQLVKNDPTMNSLERVSALVRAALFTRDEEGKFFSAKLDELPEIVADFPDERCLFVTQSKVFAYEVVRVLKKLGHKTEAITGEVPDETRGQIVRDFTAGTIQFLVGTEAIERGLNLQASGIVVHLDLPWNPASYLQRLGRIRRLGTKHRSLRSINLVSNQTAEEYVFRTVYEKHNLFTRVFGETDVVPVDIAELARAI